jgi:hypothetical protein
LPLPSQYLQRKTGLNSQINEERATAHFTVESAQMFPADKNIWNRPLASEFFKLLTGQRVNLYVVISPLFTASYFNIELIKSIAERQQTCCI